MHFEGGMEIKRICSIYVLDLKFYTALKDEWGEECEQQWINIYI